MSDNACKKCGTPLPPDAPGGLCPGCMLNAALEPDNSSGGPSPGLDPSLSLEAIAREFPSLEILEMLGWGGMGVVYKARQPSLDRHVALKILQPRVQNDPAFAERFTREARALARLSHPNIVGVYDFGTAGTRYYFVMEYVDGINLRQALEQGRFSPEEALKIVPAVCDALQYAHEEGIVHRDIKPENILLDKRGRVKIADFGLAKLLLPEANSFTLTGAREVMGTPHYMAPEQYNRQKVVDHRADIFALGVVFYEMLTGELPVGRFAPPSQKVQLDVRLDDIVLRTLESEPERRYQSAAHVKTDVEHVTHTTPGKPETTFAANASPASVSAHSPSDAYKVAQDALKVPAIAILFSGVLYMTLRLQIESGQSPQSRGWFIRTHENFTWVQIMVGFVMILGGISMLHVKRRGLSIFTCILALLPLHPAVVISFFAGLVGLVRLSRPEVQAAYPQSPFQTLHKQAQEQLAQRNRGTAVAEKQPSRGSHFVEITAVIFAGIIAVVALLKNEFAPLAVPKLPSASSSATRLAAAPSAAEKALPLDLHPAAHDPAAIEEELKSAGIETDLFGITAMWQGAHTSVTTETIYLQSRGLQGWGSGKRPFFSYPRLGVPRLSPARDILYTRLTLTGSKLRPILRLTDTGDVSVLCTPPSNSQYYDVAPDESYVVFETNAALAVLERRNGNVVRMLPTDAGAKFPAISPDGQWIAYCTSQSLVLINPHTGAQRHIAQSTMAIELPSWSPDGKRLVLQASNRDEFSYDIYGMPLDTGSFERLTTAPGADANPCYSRDGSRILFGSERDVVQLPTDPMDGSRMSLYSMAADGTDVRKEPGPDTNIYFPRW